MSLVCLIVITSCNDASLGEEHGSNIKTTDVPFVGKAEVEIVKIDNFTSSTTWTTFRMNDETYYGITTMEGDIVGYIDSAGSAERSDFVKGFAYTKTTNGDYYIVSSTGDIVTSSVSKGFDDIIAYGEYENGICFLTRTHKKDFNDNYYVYQMVDYIGNPISEFTSDKEYRYGYYCEEGIFALSETQGNSFGDDYFFFNMTNNFSFEIEEILKIQEIIFDSGLAIVQTHHGTPTIIDSTDGSTSYISDAPSVKPIYERYRDDDEYFSPFIDGKSIICLHNHYDSHSDEAIYDLFCYNTNGSVDYINYYKDNMRNGSSWRCDDYRFDDVSGNLLLHLTGADDLKYFAIISQDNKPVTEPIAYDGQISTIISNDRFNVGIGSDICVYDGKGKLVYKLSDIGGTRISDYNNNLAIVDNVKCVDLNGKTVFNKLNMKPSILMNIK